MAASLTSKKARSAREAQSLEQIPNIGPSFAGDLRSIGINLPQELIGRDPQQLYDRLCRRTRSRQDPCVLDTFVSAVRFMEGSPARPWWHYTSQRKKKVSVTLRPSSDGLVNGIRLPEPGNRVERNTRAVVNQRSPFLHQ